MTDKEILSEKEKDFCEMGGVFGCLISLTCLIQQLFFMEDHWVTYVYTATYLICLSGFFLLSLKSALAFPLLFGGAILSLVLMAFTIAVQAFSLILLILTVYVAVTVTLLGMNGTHKRILLYRKQMREEDEIWKNR